MKVYRLLNATFHASYENMHVLSKNFLYKLLPEINITFFFAMEEGSRCDINFTEVRSIVFHCLGQAHHENIPI